MKYVDKFLGVFQPLHRAEDYQDASAGLATLQRIVQKRVEGRMWVEAELDNAAIFYFTLGILKALRKFSK